MSRIARWKVEKTKVKVVFRLQFHATHIPQSGWDKLFISFIPADSGKATAKTTKANVRNGTCKWADPIYETTRLLQDIKTKQYDEKLYKLVVAMGSSRSSILGEATINLSDYADALKPSPVALPLHGCDNSGTILHVTVQLLTSKTGFREFEQQRELRERGLQTGNDPTSPNESCGGINNQMDKINARVRFRDKSKELPLLEEEVGLNEEYADSAVGFDGSSNTSESLFAEKHETSSTHEIDSLKSTVSGDLAGLGQSPRQEKADPSDHQFSAQGTNNWVHGWGSDYSADNDLSTTHEENNRLRGCLEMAESSIQELKLEVTSLQNHADEIGNEAQEFAQKLAAEIASGEQLAKEVTMLKSECSSLKDDLGRLMKLRSCSPFNGEAVEKDQCHFFKDIQFKWLRGLVDVEDKIQELQNKASLGLHERDIGSLKVDLEALLSLLQDLKQGTGNAMSSPNLVTCEQENMNRIREISSSKYEHLVSGTGLDTELYQPELDVLHCVGLPSLVSHEPNSLNPTDAVGGKILELLRELDESKTERESLVRKMDQMECYYEALIQELEENQRQMLGELQELRNEHSTCLYTVSSAKAEMETMRKDTNEQLLRFSEEKRDLESLNKELERRALGAEAALRRARLNYSIAVNQLQKDLELLSSQVLSMYETNENLIKQAFVDSPQPIYEENQDMVRNQILNPEKSHASGLVDYQNECIGVQKQHLGGDILLQNLKRSLHLQEGLFRKVEEEACELHIVNTYLDVFSKTLQQTLLEANAEIRLMKERINELTEQLELSTESNELLMQRLQTAMNDIHFLNEYKATCIAKCNDMALQNQMLEANLQDLTCENHHLTQKITEWESLMMDFKSFESKYDAIAAEKMELATLLEKESLENGNLQREISSLQYELKTIKIDFDELASVNKNMQNTIDILQSKMQNVLSTYGESSNELCFCHESAAQESESRDLTGIVFRFEELHHNTCQKIQQLMQENKSIIDEKDRAQVSLSKAESDILLLKQKFEHDLSNMIDKLSVSSAVSQKLQLKFEAIADKLKASSKVEENYAHGHTQLFSDLDCLEVELQQLSCKNRDIAEEILALQVVTEELDWSKQTIATLTKEKQALMASLQSKSEESAKLALEVDSIKKSLQCMHDELHGERSLRDELNSTVMDITFQLNEKQSLLLDFEQQKSELIQKIAKLTEKNQDLIVSLQDKSEESAKLALEVDLFKKSLQSMHDEVHGERSLRSKLKSTVTDITSQLSEKNHQLLDIEQQKSELSQKIVELTEENQALVVSLRNKSEEAAKVALEVNTFKESLQSLHNDLDGERSLRDELKSTATDLSYQLNEKHCQLIDFDQQKTQLIQKVAELTEENQVLMVSLQRKSAESAKLALEVNAFKESMQSLHDELNGERSLMDELKITVTDITSQLNEKQCQLIDLDEQKTELFQKMEELTKENQALMLSLQIKSAESTKLELEIKTSKESLQCLPDELHSERSLRDELQSTVTDLTSQLDEKNCQLLDFDRQKSELVHLKQLVADLELEKSRACNVFLHCEKRLEIASDESKSASSLEAQLSDMHELLLAADVRLIFTRTQYEAYVEGLVQQLYSTGRLLTELHTKNLDVETILNGSVAREAHCNKENVRLLRSLDTERSQLHSSIAENRILLGRNSILTTELEKYKNRVESRAVSYDEDKSQLALEVERMKHMLVGSKEEIDDLVMCREELDIQCLVLKGKLKEQSARIILFERCNDELMMLQNRYDELTRKLSEQILKAEEFRNLSIHLKELKDRAEAECIQLREKRESEGPPTGMQESLRIAFIKEQYETKLQELKHQLSISKKHSEEMLWKLQDAIDEIENRKKSEASHLKKNEELGMKILELEAELQSVISDKREKMRAYDLLKAELECSLMSLECCKEEKQKLEASLQECYEEKSKLSIDLTMMRAVLDSSTSTIQKESTDGLHTESCITVSNGQMGDGNPKYLERESMMNYDDPQNTCLECIDESSSSNALMDEHLEQGLLVSSSLSAYPSLALVNQGNLNISKSKPLAIINDQFREQSLKSSMEYLNEELERMKSENSLVSYDNHHVDLKFPGLQRELMQLNKVNEELGTIYPVFNDQPGSGNAIERVLALEIELAEALQTKKKSSIHFQSSFLKQHNDEKAIFRSFRDINELIKEILEVKGRYAAVETELKEMHDRYSQLSLQFAEVEGERQKLMMTLKNVRASKRTLQLFRSSSASLGDSE